MNALALAAWFAAAGASAAPSASPAPELSTLRFADQLAAEGDWYRAITEYRRFAHDQPSHPLAGPARLRVGDLYAAAGRHDAAASAYDDLAGDAPIEALAAEAVWRAAGAFERAGRGREASARFDRFVMMWPAGPRGDHARYRRAWSLVSVQADGDAAQALARDPPTGEYAEPAAQLAAALATPPDSGKSPFAAGVLSALLPGAGQAYAGRWGDGLLALLVNTTFIYGTYQAWNHDNTATAVVMGMFGLGFYLGGVFGGVNAAHRHNDRLEVDRRAALRERFEAPQGGEPPRRVDLPVMGTRW